MPDLVAVVDRRGALSRVAAALALPSSIGSALGQTLISESGDVGQGLARTTELVPPVAPAALAPGARRDLSATTGDWRFDLLRGERWISIARGGRTERLRYCTADGVLDREGYARLCYLLRDVQANKLCAMDPSMLDRLCGIQRWGEYYGKPSVFQATSGFRTSLTNSKTEGAALLSQHLYGRAVDGRPEGIPTAQFAAMSVRYNQQGGTGIYLLRNFVHVDSGRSRVWRG